MQDSVAPPSTGLVPHDISQQTSKEGQTEDNGQSQSPAACERPGSKEKQNCRHWQTHLTREHRSEQDRAAVLHKILDDSIHSGGHQPNSSRVGIVGPTPTERRSFRHFPHRGQPSIDSWFPKGGTRKALEYVTAESLEEMGRPRRVILVEDCVVEGGQDEPRTSALSTLRGAIYGAIHSKPRVDGPASSRRGGQNPSRSPIGFNC